MGQFIDKFVERLKAEDLNVLYVQIRQGGKIRGGFSRASQKTRIHTMSISKSVSSVGIGIAAGEGLLTLDDFICEAFPEYVPPGASPHLLSLRVRDLLTMTAGLTSPLFFADDPERYKVKDWIAYFFNAEFAYPPGERFLYSNFNTYILGCLVERRAKQNFLEYLRGRLFEALEIGNPDWLSCPKGHTAAANGLFLTIDELANFGEMLLGGGNFKGRQLVSEAYIREATRRQVDTVLPGQIGSNYQAYGYGYFFWMTPIQESFICNGNYGQYCLVLPQKETVISVLSIEGNNYKRIRDILIDHVLESLYP
jgi:CubicO group peptidase (beta-lactamase class C family)